MGYDCKQFRMLIGRVCTGIKLCSPGVENLLLGTAAVESDFGTYMTQLDGGPGCGAFQMEPETEMDIWKNHLSYRPDRAYNLYLATGVEFFDPYQMEVNIAYGIAMARLKYRMVSDPLPPGDDVVAMGRYWKTHYNTAKGKGTVEEFVAAWEKYVAGGGF